MEAEIWNYMHAGNVSNIIAISMQSKDTDASKQYIQLHLDDIMIIIKWLP
jgi:hypothetical protein